jgi:hypothetical protein
MKKYACQYAIIQFLPYAETGEFANVGVVLACPELGFFDALLVDIKRTKRITDFFEGLDARIYREALKYLRQELDRLRDHFDLGIDAPEVTTAAFGELTRPREALLRFGDQRVVVTNDVRAALKKLFNHFIERDFATKEYHEEILTRGVGKMLARAQIKTYFEAKSIGDDVVTVRFPFVNRVVTVDQVEAAIKPLHLAKDEANKIIDHGGHWVDRVRRLQRHHKLPALLFAVQMPDDNKRLRAANEIVNDLKGMGVQVVDAQNEEAVIEFATAAVPR